MPDPGDSNRLEPAPAAGSGESWLNSNVAPVLAIMTVVLTFIMFAFFVLVVCEPTDESKALSAATKCFAVTESAFRNVSASSQADKAAKDQARKERDRQKGVVDSAREAVEDARERRAMEKDFILYILGVLSAALTTIFGYYFGSSKGSADKSDALHAIMAKGSPPPAASQAPVPSVAAAPPEGKGGAAGSASDGEGAAG